MKFGLAIFPTEDTLPPAELGREAEARGFESLFFPEHTHIPVSRETPWPGGGDVPYEYPRNLDPFVAMAAAATATENLRVGTGICLVVERDPIILAKEVASVDYISGGRVLFGIGGGWNVEEMANHGTDYPKRWKVLRERIEAMQEIWTKDEAAYHGEFVNFDPIWCWPKPVQKPHPPILVGGHGERTLQRVVRYGDEWMPLCRAESYSDDIQRLNSMAAEAGREPPPVSLFFAPLDVARLEGYQKEGFSRFIFYLQPVGADKLLPQMDKIAEMMRKFD
jgi:probable F420-dependent oxidoreductase